MPPGFLAAEQVQGFDRQFRRLLGSEASPFVAAFPFRRVSLLQVSLRLAEPVTGAVRHKTTVAESPALIQKQNLAVEGVGPSSLFA